ncbi:hypothetical protein, partial [Kitasatospora sp. NPDC007106]|uniref:hypothetical protein n=1 Tax=Kitasatospora sp. NPDC007106 TaxID=3156914 RepID=UPI0033DBA918
MNKATAVALVAPALESVCANRSFVLVFPDEPVTPIRVTPGICADCQRVSFARASMTSSTSTAGAPHGRDPSTPAASAATAA